MARRQSSTNENQLSLFDMLQGTAESQSERRLALTLTDIGGGAGIFISDEGKDRLNDHAKTLGNEELADAYFQAVRDFEEAGLEGRDRSHLIHNAYLAELSRRRLVRTQPRGLEPIAPPEGQPLSIVPWGTGPEQYHLARLELDPTGDDLETRLTDHLTREIERARGNQLALEARPATTAQQITESAVDRESVTPGTIRYIDRDGKTQFQNFDASTGRWEDIKRTPGTNEAEWKALIDLRDTTTALRNAYRDRDESVVDLRDQLNEQYDSYVSAYGALNRFEHPKPKPPTKAQQSSRYNQLVAEWRAANGEGATTQPPADLAEKFRDDATQPITPETKVLKHIGALRYDPHIYSLLAIEVFDEDTQTAHKGRIFTGDPTPPAKVVEHADNLADGIDISLHQHGTIDPAFIAELTNKTTEQVEEELVTTRHAFRDPANPTAFIRAEAYLSGVVEDKLADAMHKARTDERFQANVAALTDVLPTRITEGIEIRPGVTWIDESFYRQFISETFEIPDRYFEIHRVGDTWHIDYDRDWWTDNGTAHDVSYGLIAAHSPYRNPNYNFQASTEPARSFKNQGLATNRNDGTVFTALDLFETALNVSSPTVNHSKAWREEYPDSPAINKEATDFAQRRTAALREAFSTWVAKDPERHTQLIDEYNRRFNSYVPARWRPRSQAIPG